MQPCARHLYRCAQGFTPCGQLFEPCAQPSRRRAQGFGHPHATLFGSGARLWGWRTSVRASHATSEPLRARLSALRLGVFSLRTGLDRWRARVAGLRAGRNALRLGLACWPVGWLASRADVAAWCMACLPSRVPGRGGKPGSGRKHRRRQTRKIPVSHGLAARSGSFPA